MHLMQIVLLCHEIQSVEMQLGLALECEKATLSVKRRLACEAVSYFSQVSDAFLKTKYMMFFLVYQ